MKKTIQATSKRHKWTCGSYYTVEKFIDAERRTRYQIVMDYPQATDKILISKRAIKAMANNEYKTKNHDAFFTTHILPVASPYGYYTGNEHQRAKFVRAAKAIVRELDIK